MAQPTNQDVSFSTMLKQTQAANASCQESKRLLSAELDLSTARHDALLVTRAAMLMEIAHLRKLRNSPTQQLALDPDTDDLADRAALGFRGLFLLPSEHFLLESAFLYLCNKVGGKMDPLQSATAADAVSILLLLLSLLLAMLTWIEASKRGDRRDIQQIACRQRAAWRTWRRLRDTRRLDEERMRRATGAQLGHAFAEWRQAMWAPCVIEPENYRRRDVDGLALLFEEACDDLDGLSVWSDTPSLERNVGTDSPGLLYDVALDDGCERASSPLPLNPTTTPPLRRSASFPCTTFPLLSSARKVMSEIQEPASCTHASESPHVNLADVVLSPSSPTTEPRPSGPPRDKSGHRGARAAARIAAATG